MRSPRNMRLGAGRQEHVEAWSEPLPQSFHRALLRSGTGSQLGVSAERFGLAPEVSAERGLISSPRL